MEENQTPGIDLGGISADVFGLPTGAAWDALKLILGNWLDLVFDAGGASNGSATIVTDLAGYMNFPSYIMITVIMAFVLITGVINTAAEGKVLGSNMSTTWLPLRTILSCMLIFPIGMGSATTISASQILMVWLGGIGNNLADRASEYIVNNLKKKAFTTDVTINGYKAVSDMTSMGFCMKGFNTALPETDTPSELYAVVAGTPKWELNGPNTYGMQQGSSTKRVALDPSLADSYSSLDLGFGGNCGSLKITAVDGQKELAQDIMEVMIETQIEVYEEVVRPVVDLGINANSIRAGYERVDIESEQTKNIKSTVNQSIANQLRIMSEYEETVSNLIVGKMDESNDKVDFEKDGNDILIGINTDAFNDNGWLYLGAYYTVLSKAIGNIQDLALMAQSVTNHKAIDGCSVIASDRNSFKNAFGFFSDDENEVCQFSEINDIAQVISNESNFINSKSGDLDRRLDAVCDKNNASDCDPDLLEKYFTAKISKTFTKQDNTSIVDDSSTAKTAMGTISMLGWGNGVASWGFDEVETGEGDTGISYGALYISDPISFTSQLGNDIVYNALKLKLTLKTAEGVSTALINNGIPLASGIPAFIGGVVAFTADFLGTILSILYPVGSTMAFFLPLLPALIWAMAGISWLLLFVEGIFMAPLAVILMATPEGSGILGSRMERKIAMLAALILKPLLLVVGMLLSMMILGVGFVFLNQVYLIATASTFSGFNPVAVVAVIVTWCSVMVVFMTNTFKIIPTFADNSLEWFLGGIAKPFGNDLDGTAMNDLKSSTAETSQIGSGTGKSIGIFAGNSIAKKVGKDQKEN